LTRTSDDLFKQVYYNVKYRTLSVQAM